MSFPSFRTFSRQHRMAASMRGDDDADDGDAATRTTDVCDDGDDDVDGDGVGRDDDACAAWWSPLSSWPRHWNCCSGLVAWRRSEWTRRSAARRPEPTICVSLPLHSRAT